MKTSGRIWVTTLTSPHRRSSCPTLTHLSPPEGRRRLGKLIIDDGWPIRRAADRYQVSPATASKWAKRHQEDHPLTDRSSRPHTSPNQLSKKRERRIIALRF